MRIPEGLLRTINSDLEDARTAVEKALTAVETPPDQGPWHGILERAHVLLVEGAEQVERRLRHVGGAIEDWVADVNDADRSAAATGKRPVAQ
ncbi:MAG: hypothetical protein LT071_09655 [Nocardioides sp.]|nr:hypothetical protein [Nocardioides sp.]